MGNHLQNRLTVYEHQCLKLDEQPLFEKHHLEALQRFYGEKGTNYYTLINKGVKFNQYVGVIQVGKLVIEVLPKTDNGKEEKWRNLLIGMLRAVGTVKIFSSGTANLKLKSNSVLDLYFEMFVSEAEQLMHRGLLKQYRRQEENRSSLKGKIHFPKHIQQNLIHQERFFVDHQIYDRNNTFNKILYTALVLIKSINTSAALQSRIGALLLSFPELPSITVTDTTFSRLSFSRKTEAYREAINIARLILLNYHPDLSKGQNNVLALMFDMNVLWERFILTSLRKYPPEGLLIKGKIAKPFWELENGLRATIEPDIVIEKGEQTIILDTKWKIVENNRPSDNDLKQMYTYTKYYQSSHTALVYPGNDLQNCKADFYLEGTKEKGYPCSILRIGIPENGESITKWQELLSTSLINAIKVHPFTQS
jgi:5-methylcytosine-specific restriction enzyme subunit McrC